MAKLILDGKALSAAIAESIAARSNINVGLHIQACSAVLLAVKHGRADHINEIHDGLMKVDRLAADGFRAWLSPVSKAWFRGKTDADGKTDAEILKANQDRKWLGYETKGKDGKPARGFYINSANRAWQADAPKESEVNKVSDNLRLSFVNVTAASAKKNLEYFDGQAKVAAMIKQMDAIVKAVDEGKVILPTKFIKDTQESLRLLAKNILNKSAEEQAAVEVKPETAETTNVRAALKASVKQAAAL